jgi:hypothetical protein
VPPGEQHGDPVPVADLTGTPELDQPGQAGRAGGVDRDAGPGHGQPAGLDQRVLAHDQRPAAGQQHALHHGPPVVGLVVEDAGGHALGLLRPGLHERRPVTCGIGHGPVDGAGGGMAGQLGLDAPVGAFQRVGAGRLHGVDPGQPGYRAQLGRLAQGLDGRAGQRSPADLDDEVIQAVVAEVGDKLVAERLPALDGQAVLGALGGERQRTVIQFPAQRQVRGVAPDARLAGADDHRGPQVAQPAGEAGVGLRRDEHGQRPAAGPGHHGRRQGRVPAARDGQGAATGRVEQAEALHDGQMDEHAHKMPALVRAGHVAGLVLDQHAAGLGEAQRRAEFRAAGERRGAEAVAVHRGDRGVERDDQIAVGLVGQAAGRGHVVGVHAGAVAQEGIRVGVTGDARTTRVEDAGQHVVGVVGPGPRAAERAGVGRVGDVAAPVAANDAGEGRHPARPVRWLNSVIMASQAGSRSRRPAQNR